VVDDEDIGSTKISNRALIAFFVAIVTGAGGFGYFKRSDPYTGTEGKAAERRLENLEKQLARFIERGPKDVTANQRKIMVMGDTIIDKIKEFQAQEVQVRKQHDRLEKNMQIMLNFKDAEMGSDDRFHRGMDDLHSEHKEILKEVRKK